MIILLLFLQKQTGGGDGRDGRLRIASLANDQAAVRVLGSASLRTEAVDHRRESSRLGGRGGKEGPGSIDCPFIVTETKPRPAP